MSVAENKALVRRFLEEEVNTGAVDRLAEFIAPDYLDRNDQGRGVEGARRHVLGVRQTYPDLHVTVGQQIAEGEWVVTRVTGRGTHLGAWLGLRPTGKAVEISGVNIDRVVDGRIVEHGGVADLLGPLLAMGAIQWVAPENPIVKA
jgi:predicted ester cyclase